jgi:ABC-type spermidine/putrescine transport system permease subunit I
MPKGDESDADTTMANPPLTATTPDYAATNRLRLPLGLARGTVGPGLILPAVLVTLLFSIIPLGYIAVVSLTHETDFFFGAAQYSLDNYRHVWQRYQPHIWTTLKLATLSSLINLVFGYPFAYILIRRVRYRELVRTMMTFPLFGPLYLSFGLQYLLLPNGPLGPTLVALNVPITKLLYSLPSVLFGMALFTFPFMVMNVGAALSNIDPALEEAARSLGAKPWQVFWRVLFPLSRGGILAGFLMCFGWNLGVYVVPVLLGTTAEQRVLSIAIERVGMKEGDYGLASAIGIVLMILAFGVTWLSLRFSRGALVGASMEDA